MSGLRKNVASQNLTFALVDITTGQAKAGLSPAIKWAKDNVQSASAGSLTDLTNGQYNYAPTQAETNCTSWGMLAVLAGYISINLTGWTVAFDPTDAVRMGLTALPNVAAGATNGLPLSVDASGRVDVLKINGTSQTARDIGASVIAASVSAGGIANTSFAANAVDAAALATDAGQEIADRLLARNVAGGSDTGRVVKEAIARLRNRSAIAAGTLTVYQTDDVSAFWTAAITTTAGNPVSDMDPA